jgi:uncharacterized RDD family membrane protein YckC
MPIKVRCGGCETNLNVPDNAAGRTIACPKCKEKIKVPGGANAGGGKSAPKKESRPAKKKPEEEGALFGGMKIDDYAMEHEEEQICPYCATEMEVDDEGDVDPVCSKCGMNIETGKMDPKEAKRRARKGPPIEEYWGKVWTESFAFLKQYPSLAIRTGMYVGLFMVLTMMSSYLVSFCVGFPTKGFWGILGFVCILGIPGWYSVLCRKIVSSTILKEEIQTDRIFFDMFEAMSAGMRMLFWPFIVMMPILPVWIIILLFVSTVAAALGGPIGFAGAVYGLNYAVCIWFLPIAICHFTAKYTYKGWILWELLKLMGKNGGGAAYWVLVSGVIMLPIAVVAVPTLWLLGDGNVFFAETIVGEQHFRSWQEKENQQAADPNAPPKRKEYEIVPAELPATTDISGVGVSGVVTLWLLKITELSSAPSPGDFWYYIIKGPINIAFAFLIYLPICVLGGFSLVFMMKANAVFAHYFQPTLGLVQRITPLTPATFWVRFLSYTVDSLLIPFTSILVTADGKAMMVAWAMNGIGFLVFWFSPHLIPLYVQLLSFYTVWMYWVVQESSPMRSTLGQDGFGLIVVPEDSDKPMSFGQANGRFFLRVLSQALFHLPFLMSLTNPACQALHDKVTKTRVVWKGDK